MPPLEIMDLHTPALYFPPGKNKYGETTRGDYVQIMTRWETGRREAIGPDGTPIALECTLAVDRCLRIGGLIWMGCEDDWLGTGSGNTDQDDREILEIRIYSEAYDVLGKYTRREVGLAFHKQTVPDET